MGGGGGVDCVLVVVKKMVGSNQCIVRLVS